jgi:hypothetical protein
MAHSHVIRYTGIFKIDFVLSPVCTCINRMESDFCKKKRRRKKLIVKEERRGFRYIIRSRVCHSAFSEDPLSYCSRWDLGSFFPALSSRATFLMRVISARISSFRVTPSSNSHSTVSSFLF